MFTTVTVGCWIAGNILLSISYVLKDKKIIKRFLFMVLWFAFYGCLSKYLTGYFFTDNAATIQGKIWIGIKYFTLFWFWAVPFIVLPFLYLLYRINKANKAEDHSKITIANDQ